MGLLTLSYSYLKQLDHRTIDLVDTRQMYVFMQFENLVEKFLEDKKLEGRAPGTIEEYRFRLTEVGVFLKENNLNYQNLTSADISAFSRYLFKKGQKNQTIKNKISTFCVINKWMVKEGLLPEVIVTDEHYPKITNTKRIRRLTDNDFKQFKHHIDGLQPNIRAAFYLMIGTGCRVGEAAHLRPVDVSLRGGAVYIDIHDAKWGSDRTIPITDKEAARVVWKYREECTIDNRPLFRVSRRTLQWYATDFSKKTGIKFHCHLLRHTYAAFLTEKGVPLPTIQYLLGHKSLSMTAHYAQSAITDLSEVTPTI